MWSGSSYGDTKDLAFAVARFFVRVVRSVWKAGNSQEQNARAVAQMFASADIKDSYDTLDILAYEVATSMPFVCSPCKPPPCSVTGQPSQSCGCFFPFCDRGSVAPPATLSITSNHQAQGNWFVKEEE